MRFGQVTLYVLNFHAFTSFERYFLSEKDAYEYAAERCVYPPFYVYPRSMDYTNARICLRHN